ncbi:hypothetical protein ATANTOWER_004147 [Ataeniobius toweri]|uniref:Uncharacterized protein n=1 Tax=Ataeniobius toweri TaxID=208326 RepID=A0ABU7AWF4_9TELE|nr:hypothetical protein [Ataeniobius toweri]
MGRRFQVLMGSFVYYSTILLVLKKRTITGVNNYRPVVLMSVVMKFFGRLVMYHLKVNTGKYELPQGQFLSPACLSVKHKEHFTAKVVRYPGGNKKEYYSITTGLPSSYLYLKKHSCAYCSLSLSFFFFF